jgi:hypothetical protein
VKPAILVENLLSVVAFPGHALTSVSELDGYEDWRVTNGFRHADDGWRPTAFDTDAWLAIACDRVRAFNGLALDRVHNLRGFPVELHVSFDGLTTWEVVPFTIPAGSAPGSLDDPNGVVTEEGAWLVRYPFRAGMQARFWLPAMGADLRPQIGGLWLGTWLELDWLSNPYEEDHTSFATAPLESDAGWKGGLHTYTRGDGQLGIRVQGFAGYDPLRVHLGGRGHYGVGRAMWLVHDADAAERGKLVRRPAGRQGLGFGSGDAQHGWRSGQIAYEEWQPAVV